MKRLFFGATLFVFFNSCETKNNSEVNSQKNILENLTYSVDTVVVDPAQNQPSSKTANSTPMSMSKTSSASQYSPLIFKKP